MKVVSNLDGFAKGICQNPLLALSLLKIWLLTAVPVFRPLLAGVHLSKDAFIEWLEVNTDSDCATLLRDCYHACAPLYWLIYL